MALRQGHLVRRQFVVRMSGTKQPYRFGWIPKKSSLAADKTKTTPLRAHRPSQQDQARKEKGKRVGLARINILGGVPVVSMFGVNLIKCQHLKSCLTPIYCGRLNW